MTPLSVSLCPPQSLALAPGPSGVGRFGQPLSAQYSCPCVHGAAAPAQARLRAAHCHSPLLALWLWLARWSGAGLRSLSPPAVRVPQVSGRLSWGLQGTPLFLLVPPWLPAWPSGASGTHLPPLAS